MKKKSKGIFFLSEAVLGVLVGVMATLLPGSEISPSQPLHFEHKTHWFRCDLCHQGVNTKDRAGIPAIDLCIKCHNRESERKANPYTDEIRKLYEKGEDLKWMKYTNFPLLINFSHKQHVKWGKVSCQECHGNTSKSTLSTFKVIMPTMDACIGCHERKKISNDCANCHR